MLLLCIPTHSLIFFANNFQLFIDACICILECRVCPLLQLVVASSAKLRILAIMNFCCPKIHNRVYGSLEANISEADVLNSICVMHILYYNHFQRLVLSCLLANNCFAVAINRAHNSNIFIILLYVFYSVLWNQYVEWHKMWLFYGTRERKFVEYVDGHKWV